ncbi:endo-1,4-beta-xylanase [Lutibacter sp. TH_r2]|uniref:endo-1,4-beta-xylanase n=1 Tax=Lutibacter sp. TH_r2 TaxID=3082083 RepID=UPI002955AEBC|nr:endo-1,4-beta-xylanase [Lutibacter sp. TH_r2]MDV7187974.1 endo-1,4-beta-xylanase [Lutibacter sp. TH_r2]
MKIKFIHTFYIFIIGSLFTLTNCADAGDDSDIAKDTELGSPIINSATNVTSEGFTVSWTRVYNADGYELDISINEDFESFVVGYEAKSTTMFSEDVYGLDEGTNYFYRVRAVSSTEKSKNSGVLQVTTLEANGPELTTYLKDTATTFYVGMAVKSDQLTDGSKYDEILKNEFSSISGEYEMKMNIIQPTKGNYDWSKSDALVDYATANGINVHGHALVWHESTPDWLENYTGTDAEFEQEVKDYITAVLTRYKGKVTSWDVVNEAINNTDGSIRSTVFSQKMGNDYVAKCFQFARDADPDVLLFYNDYSVTTDITKQAAIFNLIDNMQTNNVPIDGIGFQMHIQYNSPSVAQMETAVDKVVDRGLKLHFSELDVRVNPDKDITELTAERAVAQKNKIKEVVEVYNAIPTENKYAITIWGMKDDESWLLSFYNNYNEWPLLYDTNFEIKKAHTGFLEGLK